MKVNNDIKKTISFLEENYPGNLDSFKKPSSVSSIYQAALAWGLIFLSAYLTYTYSMFFLPITLVIVGSRQRVLNNIIHDASHKNCFTRLKTNDLFATLFACLPLFEDIKKYRKQHNSHHANLSKKEDPDLLETDKLLGNKKITSWNLYISRLFSTTVFLSSFLGRFLTLSFRERVMSLSWWFFFSIITCFFFGIHFSFFVIILWFLSKATIYHAVVSFTELTDHAGLDASSIFSFSRTLPNNLIACIFHPHGDVYHLAHHLLPNIPISKLGRVHNLLMRMEEYKNSPRYQSYFRGEFSVFKTMLKNKPSHTKQLCLLQKKLKKESVNAF